MVGGQKVRARQYPWGTVEVENEGNTSAGGTLDGTWAYYTFIFRTA